MLGNLSAKALLIFTFCVSDGRSRHIHPQFFTQLLGDMTGGQARGCACAGPQGHRLLGIDYEAWEHIRTAILEIRETD